MATETDETYFRKWLDDPTTIVSNTPQQVDTVTPVSPDITYFRKYLNDHA